MNRKLIVAGVLGLAVLVGSVATSLGLNKAPWVQLEGQALSQAQDAAASKEPAVPQAIAIAQEQNTTLTKPTEQSKPSTTEQDAAQFQKASEATKNEKAAAPAKTSAPAAATSSSRSLGNLKVTGSASFTASVNKALALLSQKAPNHARKVAAYLKEIRESDHSGVAVQTGVFNLGRNTVDSQDTYWLASVIVHDAYHSELYQKGQDYTGKEAEARCIEVQKDALLEMGAPASYQTHLNNVLQSNYWDVPYEQRNW